MDYVIDTSVLIEIENDNKQIIEKLISEIKDYESSTFYITYFCFCEFYYGHIKKNIKNKKRIIKELNKYNLLNTTMNSGILFCEIMNELRQKGRPIPVFDILSSSVAIDNNLCLITLDKHFKEIPQLKAIVLE